MSGSSRRRRSWLFALTLWSYLPLPLDAAEPAEAGKLLASTVCILGDIRGDRFTSTGFVVPPGDQIMTTAHGLASVTKLRAKLQDGRVFALRLERLGNERADIALLALIGVRLPAVELGSVGGVKAGEEVSTIGCPQGFEFSVTRGVVSAVRQSDLGYPLIQTDVPVNPGSSGGPLFDRDGRVVGIVKGKVTQRERIHFALPIDLGKALLEESRQRTQAYEIFNQAVLEPQLAEKVPLYEKALALAPDLPEAHYNLALILEKLGKPAAAEKEYREALRLLPSHEAAALNLGALLHAEGRYAEAVAACRKALAELPGSVRLRNNLAEAYRALGQTERARREFERILAAKDDYPAAHYGLAVLYEDQLHDTRRAAEHYRRYLALAPEAADADRVRDWLRRVDSKR